jgi:hypothetical protein
VSGTSSVEHVVLTSKDKQQVVQPLSKEPFTEDVQNAFGAKLQYTGLIATFPLDAVRELRGGKADQEFNVIVVGNGRKERQFTVKKKHFERLP